MDVTNFIAISKSSKEALKSANLLKSVQINCLIEGDIGTGKTTLAKYIVPNAPIINGNNFDEILNLSTLSNVAIITDFENITNLQKLYEIISKNRIRIIATTKKKINDDLFDQFFGVKIFLPSLKERIEDLKPLARYFFNEAKKTLGIDIDEHSIDYSKLDLSQNCISLKRSIYFYILSKNLKDNEIISILEIFLEKNIGTTDDYRKFLYLYEAPLIKVALNKYKSQLQVAEQLGLNRNTLRKKINDLKDFL
ncbi:MAG: Fis family transcriptional regulator [Campylobacterales bacterium]|nr:Fis family transcriptional regulator [Campylobacterales bacterium]